MSLINDALKRAKQAQQQAAASQPPQPDMELRPVEPRQYARPTVGLTIPVLLGLASLVLLVLLWQTARNSNSQNAPEVTARARTATAAAGQTAPPTAATTPAAQTSPSPAPTPSIASQEVAAQSSATNPPISAAFAQDAPTNPAPVAAVAPPKPVLPKLQAIVFHPTRPSVMINGKSLFVGEKIGEFRVRSIEQDSVTLVGAGQTNILTLPE
jgi:hypothetical protein